MIKFTVIRVPDTQEELARALAVGPCLCKDIDVSDTPCLTCQAREELELFWCPRCERLVPWDFGAADETPALCDDCAVFVQDLWEGNSKEKP